MKSLTFLVFLLAAAPVFWTSRTANLDLSIVEMSHFQNMTNIKSIRFDLKLTNRGSASASLAGVSFQCWLSKDNLIGNADDALAGGAVLSGNNALPLAAGQIRLLTDLWANYSNINLTDYPFLIVKIDSQDKVKEMNEKNNLRIVEHKMAN